jgi:hypothetical protein
MRLQPFLITAILAVGLAMPAMAEHSNSTRRSAINAPFGTYGGGRGSLIAECRPSCGVPNNHNWVPPEARKCVFTCIDRKLAAQQ